jgi:electron transfer flavoprotein alpha subunit
MLAVVPVRAGELPAGGAEAVADAGGRVLLVGDDPRAALDALGGLATEARVWDAGDYAPARWAATLAPLLATEPLLLLPGSPDGRDLAPRLAAALERPLYASVMRVRHDTVTTIAHGGSVLVEHAVAPAAVLWLQPGVRGVEPVLDAAAPEPEQLAPDVVDPGTDPVLDEVLPPDVATMDLSEAPRLLGGGAGLDSAQRFEQLGAVAAALDAAMGATRVITDRGWIDHARQIGTTGVVVDPKLYLAFGISGAVQHTAGLGSPEHVISVNVDPHCPMMELADLAVVADANATLEHLAARLGLDTEVRTGG